MSFDAARLPKRNHNSILPINNLPVEIISHIFLQACFDLVSHRELKEYLNNLQRVRASVMLTCTLWCDVAVDTPLLWSIISIELEFLPDHPCPVLSTITELQLQRSKECTLSLYLHLGTTLGVNPWYSMKSLAQSLGFIDQYQCRFRTESLEIVVEGPNHNLPAQTTNVLFNTAQKWPVLSEVMIWTKLSYGEMCGSHIDLSSAPSLRSLLCENTRRIDWTFAAPEHSTLITRLTLNWNFEASSTLSLLASCPFLEDLFWYQTDTTVTMSSDPPVARGEEYPNISFPHLHILRMGFESIRYLDLFDINGPCDLYLSGNSNDYRTISSRRCQNIRRLTTTSVFWEERSFLDFVYTNRTSLQEIVINRGPLYPGLPGLLVNSGNSITMFPYFSRISLGFGCCRCEDTQDTLNRLVQQLDDSPTQSPLTFSIYCHPPRKPQPMPAIISHLMTKRRDIFESDFIWEDSKVDMLT